MKTETKEGMVRNRNETQGSILSFNLALGEAIKEFLYIKEAVENVSERTIETYQYTFDDFQNFLDEKIDVVTLDKSLFRKYITHLRARELSLSTISINYRNLRSFFNWLVSEGYAESNPLTEISEPKTPDKYPRTITEEQTNKLLEAARTKKSNWIGQRDYTMLLLFIESGLRLNEMVSAEVDNLDLENHLLTVSGKGNKERNVSFGAKVCKVMRKWMVKREELEKVYDNNIFLDRGGETLNRRNVQDRINKIQQEAGLGNEKVSPHVLRHTSVTLSAKNGMNATQLRQMYGWKSLKTAIKYIHLSGRDVKEAMKDASPIDSL